MKGSIVLAKVQSNPVSTVALKRLVIEGAIREFAKPDPSICQISPISSMHVIEQHPQVEDGAGVAFR